MRKRFVVCVATLFLAVFGSATGSRAQIQAVDAAGHQWWQNAVFYTIYPRSFADSNNDGIGDLKGITSKLDYLKQLGVDAIWITPCYPSPQVDFGYDISDYENINPEYGTLKDFDDLVQAARKRGIRILLDLVLNHTSDQHKWFVDSRSSRASAHRDWYIWRDGKNGGLPTNWVSVLGGRAWTLDPTTGQYYYHAFYSQQPDLNWRNPAVKNAMFDVARWWYKRGVAGFRLDAVGYLFEDPNFQDNPLLGGTNKYGDPREKTLYDGRPEAHAVLRDLRKLSDEYSGVLIGETWTKTIEELQEYYGPHHDELQMPMDFMFTTVDKLSPDAFRKQIASAESLKDWPVYVMSNMDISRSYDRYGDGQHNDAIAKLMAGLYLTLRGTPILWYGEEIGMKTTDPTRLEDVKDPVGRVSWPDYKGRDGERTPMQWSNGHNGGFTEGRPWLPVPPTAATYNVDSENKDPKSILEFYRRLLAMRHQQSALLYGDYVPLNQDDPHVLSYLRRYKDEAILVVLNMSGHRQKIRFDLAAQGVAPLGRKVLLSSSDSEDTNVSDLLLEPYAVHIVELSSKPN